MDEFALSGQTIDLAHWLNCYAFDVIGNITYSRRFGFLDEGEDIGGIMAALKKIGRYGSLVGIYNKLHPWLYALNEKIPGSGAAGRTYLMTFTRARIAERMEARRKTSYKAPVESMDEESDVPRDFLDKLADRNQQDPSKITPYDIFATGMSNIIAGADTTAISLASTMYHLITTPRVLLKLREEVAQHRGETGRLSFKQTQDMPYLQLVIKEALRMHPAVGLPLWRVVPAGGAEVAGQFFPAGTRVGVNSWVTQYDAEVYGPDVYEFKPERWEEKDTEKLQRMEANWIPFGLGSRTCLGRHISFLEMSKLIPGVVANFNYTMTMPKEQWKGNNFWFVKPEKLSVQVSKIKSV
ncbi:Pisatin demethylase [Cyphellophora attinorum]|uniref:Pisatin demethylase n=1 Tax=Cyphellophora attinorum TaxID=1664694 RepID=A0A0N0NQ46_9EURO|nr:Pisatin demethylase [Phialophora attinorum]KPI43279.1 Pisatin demethylase [Phialophora attinorum]